MRLPSELRSFGPSPTPLPGYEAFDYLMLHHPTQKRFLNTMYFLSRQHFLEQLDVWNSSNPVAYHYWSAVR